MTISFARLGRVAGVAVTALSLTGALAGTASAVTFTGHDAHAKAVAPSPAVSGNAMCLNASTPPRRNGGPVYLWQCEPQQFQPGPGHRRRPDHRQGHPRHPHPDVPGREQSSPPATGAPVYLWQCEPGNSNQAWVIDGAARSSSRTPAAPAPRCAWT